MKHAFTLIELLVVVTIIVILIALLIPAMDQAIYQAELAICGTRQHTIAVGAIQYAMNAKRRYPDRPARRSNGSNRPIDLYFGLNQLHDLDDRLILKQFIAINKTLNCPLLSKPIDIEGSDVNGAALSPYGLYFGWGYAKKGDKEMRKLGDRWTYTIAGNGTVPAIVESFSVLSSDWDSIYSDSSTTYGTHPDKESVMVPYYSQNQGGAGFVGNATFSYWIATKRPPIDANYAFDDGSVLRFNDVTWDEGDPSVAGSEKRLVWANQSDSQNQATWFFRLPGTR